MLSWSVFTLNLEEYTVNLNVAKLMVPLAGLR